MQIEQEKQTLIAQTVTIRLNLILPLHINHGALRDIKEPKHSLEVESDKDMEEKQSDRGKMRERKTKEVVEEENEGRV